MKIACSTLQYMQSGIDLIKSIESIGRLEYEAIELTFGEGFAVMSPELPETKQILKSLKKNNLKICSFGSNLWWGIGGEFAKQNREMLEKIADVAVELGSGFLKLSTGYYMPFITRDNTWKYIIDNFAWAADMTEKKGLKLAVEPVVEWPINNGATFMKMRTETGKNIYLNADPSNLGLGGDDPVKTVRDLYKYVGIMHIKDSNYKRIDRKELHPWMIGMVLSYYYGTPSSFVFKGAKPEFPPLGMGDVDFKGLFTELKKMKYDGYLVVEDESNLCGYKDSAEEASRKSLKYIKKVLKEIEN
jgi:sugar phosphate isomerase/epimerase